jgi:tetratricopeptide (TPR) repeat protein
VSMKTRFHGLLVGAVAAAGLLACLEPGLAQTARPLMPPSKAPQSSAKPHAALRQEGQNLDFLFRALKVAPDETTAEAISNRIWDIWLDAGGDTTSLLMSRVRKAIDGKDLDLALRLLDAVVAFKPDYVEAWNERATVYYLKKDYGRSLSDLAQVLAREPRHFGALFGLGIILQEFGEERRALEVYRRALEIDPHMQRVPAMVKELSEKLEGRDI